MLSLSMDLLPQSSIETGPLSPSMEEFQDLGNFINCQELKKSPVFNLNYEFDDANLLTDWNCSSYTVEPDTTSGQFKPQDCSSAELLELSHGSEVFDNLIRSSSTSLQYPLEEPTQPGNYGHFQCKTYIDNAVGDYDSSVDNQVISTLSDNLYDCVVKQEDSGLPNRTLEVLECRWDDCWNIFETQTELVQHIEKYHVDGKRRDEFPCLWQNCPRRYKPFNARYKLLIHMRVHSGDKPNKCPFPGCVKAFSRLENLKIHQRSHTGERPYSCQYNSCKKAFSNSSDRAKHQRTHFDTKPYACHVEGCSKKYTDPSSLRKHIKIHFGQQPYISKTKKLVASEPKISLTKLEIRESLMEKDESISEGNNASQLSSDEQFDAYQGDFSTQIDFDFENEFFDLTPLDGNLGSLSDPEFFSNLTNLNLMKSDSTL